MTAPTDDELRRIYSDAKTIAIVGASRDEQKPAHGVAAFLQEAGYTIIPVTPKADEVLGARAYGSLRDVEGPVDIVDVFRPAEETSEIARDAAAIGAGVLWLQEGIVSDEAAALGREAGMTVIMDLCMKKTYQRLRLGMDA